MNVQPARGRRPTWLFGPTTEETTGRIRLQAVREYGRVIDFNWVFVSEAAARLLHCEPLLLYGRGLRANLGGPLGNPALIERYRRVLENGNTQSFEQVHLASGRQDIIVHCVRRVEDGVEVMLTNSSAARRACADALESLPHATTGRRRQSD
jgi:hypothetical protein